MQRLYQRADGVVFIVTGKRRRARVDNPRRVASLDCHRKVFEASNFDGDVWKDGWAFDTRQRKFYSAGLRMKGGNPQVRA